jgi:hypothetical protein
MRDIIRRHPKLDNHDKVRAWKVRWMNELM